jgi:hypothetical protein
MFRQSVILLWLGIVAGVDAVGEEPPAINPFGPRQETREDALPGYVELSDGKVYAGQVYLTRDARLQIFDAEMQRQREVPLNAISKIECHVDKEWQEREWRFRENANDEKVYTGRSYPARVYSYILTLKNGQKISGPLSGILYVAPEGGTKPVKLLLHKRDKGEFGMDLSSLVYVRSAEFGEEALRRGKALAKRASEAAAKH